MITLTIQHYTNRSRLGTMEVHDSLVPQPGDRMTYFDDQGMIRQGDVVRERHFVQSLCSQGTIIRLFVSSKVEIEAEMNGIERTS